MDCCKRAKRKSIKKGEKRAVEVRRREAAVADDGDTRRRPGGRSNGRENTWYRQAAPFFCCLVRGEGGIKQTGMDQKGRREREKRRWENEKLTGSFCRLFNEIPERFDGRQRERRRGTETDAQTDRLIKTEGGGRWKGGGGETDNSRWAQRAVSGVGAFPLECTQWSPFSPPSEVNPACIPSLDN